MVPVVERTRRWSGVIRDQNVSFRAGRQQRCAAGRRGDIGRDALNDDLAGRLQDGVPRATEFVVVTSVEDDVDALTRQGQCTRMTQALRGGSDDGVAPSDSEIHRSLYLTVKSRIATQSHCAVQRCACRYAHVAINEPGYYNANPLFGAPRQMGWVSPCRLMT